VQRPLGGVFLFSGKNTSPLGVRAHPEASGISYKYIAALFFEVFDFSRP
jgi:hypothetical protein